MTARTTSTFKIRPGEQVALDAALRKYTEWLEWFHDTGAAVDHKELARLREATRSFINALQPLIESHEINGTRARLLVRMQEAQHFQQSQAEYLQALEQAQSTARLIDSACNDDVKRGTKADPRARAWVWAAADAWLEAGGRPSKNGRFAAALQSFHRRPLPPIGDTLLQVALEGWRKNRRGVELPPASPS